MARKPKLKSTASSRTKPQPAANQKPKPKAKDAGNADVDDGGYESMGEKTLAKGRIEARLLGLVLGYCKAIEVKQRSLIFKNFVPARPNLFFRKWTFGNHDLHVDTETGVLTLHEGKSVIFSISVNQAEFGYKTTAKSNVNSVLLNPDRYLAA